MPDSDGYPTEAELTKIEKWPVDDRENANELIEFVQGLWWTDEALFRRYDDEKIKFELHTGGWSGNELIIEALMENTLFWFGFWERSERGGHYWFEQHYAYDAGGEVADG